MSDPNTPVSPEPTPPAGSYPPPAPPAAGQPYMAAPSYAAYPTGPKTNTLAIVSLVASIVGVTLFPFIGNLVGVITGHISLGQIKRTGESGRGLALAGVIVGWVGLAIMIILTIVVISFAVWAATTYPHGVVRS